MPSLFIPQNLLKRFVQAVTLLQILNRVRGNGITIDFDHEHDDIEQSRARILMKKFLDSFALISATRKGGNCVAAACLEEGQKDGTVVRVARNAGITRPTLDSLQGILNDLAKIARREPDANAEDILQKIIVLNQSRIRIYSKDVLTHKESLVPLRSDIQRHIQQLDVETSAVKYQNVIHWVDEILEKNVHQSTDSSPDNLIHHVRWAQKAREHLEILKSFYSAAPEQPPKWTRTVIKLGRYGVAARVLVQFAMEFPMLFSPMLVKPVEAPSPVPFPKEMTSLQDTLKDIMGESSQEYHSRLSSFLKSRSRKTTEKYFRARCPSDLATHAEMQLVSFYDQWPELEPSLRFIGVSKKSCYLCNKFLALFPHSFKVSGCHGKVYERWIPPPAANERILFSYRRYTIELIQMIEAEIRRDLQENWPNHPRLNNCPPDSPAGGSMTGLSDPDKQSVVSGGSTSLQIELMRRILETFEASDNSKGKGRIAEVPSPSIAQSFTSLERPSDIILRDETPTSLPIDHSLWQDKSSPLAIVLHFTRPGNSMKQELVCVADLIDSSTGSLLWDRLIYILSSHKALGLAFEPSNEIFEFDGHIIVETKRQFIACLQYLHNSGKLNCEVLVRDREDLARVKDIGTQTNERRRYKPPRPLPGWSPRKRKWRYF